MRGAWIEIQNNYVVEAVKESLPVRGAWIEMLRAYLIKGELCVAPGEGSVD